MLPPKLQELAGALEEARGTTLATVARLPDSELFRRDPGEWSVADILEHLLIAETGTSKVIWKVLKENAGGLPPYPADDSGIDVRPLPVAPETVTKAPSVAEPRGAYADRESLLSAAARTRAETLTSLGMLAGADPRSATFPHAIFGPLNLYEWPRLLILEHERQHHRRIAAILRRTGCASAAGAMDGGSGRRRGSGA